MFQAGQGQELTEKRTHPLSQVPQAVGEYTVAELSWDKNLAFMGKGRPVKLCFLLFFSYFYNKDSHKESYTYMNRSSGLIEEFYNG